MVLGIDIPGGVSFSTCSTPESRRPVTAQERQREREEKRRKRQERAKERERKMKEKEKREGKRGDLLGGVLLSDNDKSLLQRWTKMMDSCSEKCQAVTNDGANSNDCNVNSHGGAAVGDKAPNSKTDKDAAEVPSREQVPSQVKPNQQGLFQPPSTQQPPVPFSLSQNKPPADMAAVSGGIDMTVAGGFNKNNTFKHTKSSVQGGFSCVGNWSGPQPETRPPQRPAMTSQPSPSSSFLQPHSQTQYDPKPQLLPLESFLSKAPALSTRETNGNVDVRGQNNINPLTSATRPLEKLCPSVEEKPATQSTDPLCGNLGVPSQPHPGLVFTDTGQQGPSIAPDINKVTQQLSKSQVRIFMHVSFVCI